MPLQTILNLLLVLGFMAHGYATNEFEVTAERLGCYLPTEHIDNPKGYGDGEDARKYHPGLRGPVDPRELEIDPRTGMKNYIANEAGGWDTSKALIRRLLEKCIHLGRVHRSSGLKADLYEAYRLLGTALHTLEDYPAHSNFCELALVKMGHHIVFTHVGDQVRIQAPGGKRVAPIVTGTFGSDDFFHSLLGGASDSLSEASVSDLNKEIDKARSKAYEQTRSGGGRSADPADALRELFFSLPGGDGHEMSRDLDNLRAGTSASGKTPEQMSPKELHTALWQVLVFRDSVAKKISKTIEKIPGLGPMIEKLMDSISVFVFTTIEPFMKPILQSATGSLHSVSAEVIDKHDQYEVFNDPRASDPTHSFLSKDHFNLILNEPAGLVAKVIVVNAVQLIIKAWDDTNVNVHQVIEEISESMFHPDFHNPSSKVQREMLKCMEDWVSRLNNKNATIARLSKDSVRKHGHTRAAGEASAPVGQGGYAAGQAHTFQGKIENYAQSHIPGVSAVQGALGSFGASGGGPARAMPGSGSGEAASYYNNAPEGSSSFGAAARSPPPVHPAMPHSPSAYGGSHYEAPKRSGYAPSYAPSPPPGAGYGASSQGAPSFPGAPPSFPGAPPSFAGGPSSPPSFPGAAPTFQGAPGGYDTGYGAPHTPHSGGAPGFPGAPPSFPGAAPAFPGADPYGHGHGHGHGHHWPGGGY